VRRCIPEPQTAKPQTPNPQPPTPNPQPATKLWSACSAQSGRKARKMMSFWRGVVEVGGREGKGRVWGEACVDHVSQRGELIVRERMKEEEERGGGREEEDEVLVVEAAGAGAGGAVAGRGCWSNIALATATTSPHTLSVIQLKASGFASPPPPAAAAAVTAAAAAATVGAISNASISHALTPPSPPSIANAAAATNSSCIHQLNRTEHRY